jgi:hypothetical protein
MIEHFTSVRVLTMTVAVCLAQSIAGQQLLEDDPLGRDLDPEMATITTAVPFLMIAPDSRSGAMGDVGVALSPGANSMHWNPAAMAFASNVVESSLSYSPWLRQLVDDMHLSYISTSRKIDDRRAYGVAFRYFSLGNITFTDEVGTNIRDFTPNEFSIDGGYSQKFTDRFSGGFSSRFIYSNLLGGTPVGGAESSPGVSVAADLSMYYQNDQADWGNKDGTFSWGLNLSNLGAKISYSETVARDFIPSNLRVGAAYTTELDDFNSLTFAVDANKLLVPSQPIYQEDEDGREVIFSGLDPEVGVMQGIIQSFYDAPGIVTEGEDGELFVVPGSRWKEEFREVNWGVGMEYNFAEVFAFRSGYFFEHWSKGNRQFITMGAGVEYTVFSVDMSYIISTTQQHPLANTLRFSLRWKFSDVDK